MKTVIFTLVLLLNFLGCSKQETKHYDGSALLSEKCASCHNLDMPPKTYEDEKAPPMMAVSFHIKDFLEVPSESERKPKFINFFQDFVINPAEEKSFCDKESLKSYGLMPSMKGKVTKEELGAIVEYVFDYYDQDKFLAQMQAKATFDALPKGEQVAKRKGCLTCHGTDTSKAAPAFSDMRKKSKDEMIAVIQNGSKGKWEGFERMMMPAFKDKLDAKELESLTEWIRGL